MTGTTTDLSVLGADDTGESNLIYTWSATGPAAVTFAGNGTNAAKSTRATFSKAGDYTFTATVTDPDNRTATSTVSVTVNQTYSGVSATTASMLSGFSQQMLTVDQFGQAMTVNGVTWSASAGSISGDGIYSSPDAGSTSVSITGTVEGVSANTTVSIVLPLAWYKSDSIAGPTLVDASENGLDGTLVDGSGSYGSTDGKFGDALLLSHVNAASTTGAHASLPTGIVSSLTDFTISGWVNPTSVNTWARLYDFGSGTGSYMFLSIANSSGAPRFGIKASGGSEQLVNGTTAIPTGAWTHLVVTLSGATATLYVNGVVAGTNANVTVTPSNLGNSTQNYLGESQYSADPTLKGAIDDFRIYGSAASAAAIAALYSAANAQPTAEILPVSPDPSNAPVDSIDITFSEPVSGFDLADLSLTRDGGANLLPGSASLTTSDDITWALGGLSDLTSIAGTYVLTLVAADSEIVDAASNSLAADSSESFVVQSRVVGRHLFYNNSSFDQNDPTSTTADDSALATDKSALLPGETASFSNYTSYSRGINGVMLDVQGLSIAPSASDFTFRVGNDNDPASWATAPAPTSISVRALEGPGAPLRVTITWADGEIKNQWLQVTAGTSLGLAQADVFYFGNAVGETGDNTANAAVNASDELATRTHPKSFLSLAAVNDLYDFNRDGFVNAIDQILSRSNSTTLATALNSLFRLRHCRQPAVLPSSRWPVRWRLPSPTLLRRGAQNLLNQVRLCSQRFRCSRGQRLPNSKSSGLLPARRGPQLRTTGFLHIAMLATMIKPLWIGSTAILEAGRLFLIARGFRANRPRATCSWRMADAMRSEHRRGRQSVSRRMPCRRQLDSGHAYQRPVGHAAGGITAVGCKYSAFRGHGNECLLRIVGP